MVSVIIPVYNVENYLAACLDSVLQQTYRDLEILLINDGSTDRSGEICQEYAAQDERIRYFKTENRGLSEARNLGLRSCTGEYISFVDSDDRLHPQATEFMLQAIRETGVPLVKAGFDRIPDGENPPFTRFEYEKLSVVVQDCETEIRNSFERELLRSIWSGLYSKSSLDGFHFESGRFHEDAMFTYLVLSRNEKMVRINDPLYQYRRRIGSVVNHKIAGKVDIDRLEVSRQIIEFFAEKRPEFAELAKAELISECITRKNLVLHNECDPLYEEALTLYIDDCVKKLRPSLKILWNKDIPARRRLLCLAGRISFPAACRLKYWITSILNR